MNLLELARTTLTDEQIASLASTLGESASATRQAFHDVAVPAVVAGLVRRYGRDEASGRLLADLLRDGGHATLLRDLGASLAGGVATEALARRGEGLQELLLDGRMESLAELLTQTSGLRPTSARRLLSLSIPVTLASVAGSANLDDAAGLAARLRELPEMLAATAPPGLLAALGSRDFAPLDLPVPRKPALWPWLLVPAITLVLFLVLRWLQQSSMTRP